MSLDPSIAAKLLSAAHAWRGGEVETALDELTEVRGDALGALLASRAAAALGSTDLAVDLAALGSAAARGTGLEPHAAHWEALLRVGLGDVHRALPVLRALEGDEATTDWAVRVLDWAADPSGALEVAARAAARSPDRPRPRLLWARMLLATGGRERAADVFGSTRPSPELAREVAEGCVASGDLAAADAVARAAGLADLAAWIAALRGDDATVEAELGRATDPDRAASVRAAWRLARGDVEGAHAALEGRTLDLAGELVAAELLLRRGQRSEAEEALIRVGNRASDSSRWIQQQVLLGLASHPARALASLDGVRQAVAMLAPTSTGSEALERCLAAFGANRSLVPWVRGPAGPRLLEIGPTFRQRCLRAQAELRSRPVEPVLTTLAAIAAESPHGHTYRGEVLLWLGRYDEATAAFEEPLRQGLRWAPIGAAAAHAMGGRLAQARQMLDVAQRHPAGPGPTFDAIDGEVALAEGRVEHARASLERALAARPERLGAEIVLALTLARCLSPDDAASRFARLVEHAPGLLAAASRPYRSPRLVPAAEREAVLERALAAMRGNRSSTIVTWLVEGSLAFLPRPEWLHLRLSPDELAALVRRASVSPRAGPRRTSGPGP